MIYVAACFWVFIGALFATFLCPWGDKEFLLPWVTSAIVIVFWPFFFAFALVAVALKARP